VRELDQAASQRDGRLSPLPVATVVAQWDVVGGLCGSTCGHQEKRKMKRALFICSQNRLRSPTAEQVFSTWPGVESSSAGLNHDAENRVTPELLEWADIIFVMEKAHRNKLSAQFKPYLKRARLVCLDIPDNYQFMEPALVELLLARVPKFFPAV
jgi:predicted protein tyrosine phosphatase